MDITHIQSLLLQNSTELKNQTFKSAFTLLQEAVLNGQQILKDNLKTFKNTINCSKFYSSCKLTGNDMMNYLNLYFNVLINDK